MSALPDHARLNKGGRDDLHETGTSSFAGAPMFTDRSFYSAPLRQHDSDAHALRRSPFTVSLACSLLTMLLTAATPGGATHTDTTESAEAAQSQVQIQVDVQRSTLETVICRAWHTSFLSCSMIELTAGSDGR